MLTIHELEAEGERLKKKGHFVLHLNPSQLWMSVEAQTPFVIVKPIDIVPPSQTFPRMRFLDKLRFRKWRRSLTRGERLRLDYWGATGNPEHYDGIWRETKFFWECCK